MSNIETNSVTRKLPLYKAKRIDTDEWVTGTLWSGASLTVIIPYNLGVNLRTKEKYLQIEAPCYEVNPKTIMLQSEYVDLNCNNIYSGHIVTYEDVSGVKSVGYVWYDGKSFMLTHTNKATSRHLHQVKNLKIIGNIFDDAKLLSEDSEIYIIYLAKKMDDVVDLDSYATKITEYKTKRYAAERFISFVQNFKTNVKNRNANGVILAKQTNDLFGNSIGKKIVIRQYWEEDSDD